MTLPDKVLHRILRPMPPEFFTDPSVIAILDEPANIVRYNQEVFERLTAGQKKRVVFLQDATLEIV